MNVSFQKSGKTYFIDVKRHCCLVSATFEFCQNHGRTSQNRKIPFDSQFAVLEKERVK